MPQRENTMLTAAATMAISINSPMMYLRIDLHITISAIGLSIYAMVAPGYR